jgi:signal recognition particle receptor subunit beta
LPDEPDIQDRLHRRAGSWQVNLHRCHQRYRALRTDVDCTDELRLRKETTTVAIDYGELDLGEQGRLLLYGLPGQSRFRFMFDVVRDGLLGAAVLVDATSGSPIGLQETLETYGDELRQLPCVVAINRCTSTVQGLQQRCLDLLRDHRIVAPVVSVDARRREDIVRIFDLLFLQLEHAFEGNLEATA